MTKFKDLKKTEKNMVIVLCILIILTILNWERVTKGVVDGFKKFFSAPQQVEQTK